MLRMPTTRPALFALALSAFFGTTLSHNDASAFCRMTTDDEAQVGNAPCTGDGVPLEWDSACIQYSIDQRGSIWLSMGDIEDAVTASFDEWQNTTCAGEPPNVVFQMGAPSTCRIPEFNNRGPNVNTVAFLSDWENQDGEPFDPRALAVTIVWFLDDGQIVDADMVINETLGPYDLCPDTGCPGGSVTSPGPVDLQSIVTHEAGHMLGIGHSDDETATMFAVAPREEVQKRTLAQDDINAICTIYPPGNLNASCDSTPIGGLDLNCEDALPEPTSNGGCSSSTIASPSARDSAVLLALMTLVLLRLRFPKRSIAR